MIILNILLLIFLFGVLIFIHELGHFLAAKKFKVHIYEFALGMGPKIISRKGKDGVVYSIRAFPIGGFVMMAGEVGEDDDKLKKEDFMCNKPWYQKIIILLAGVTMNFILAFVLLFFYALIWGSPNMEPVVYDVEKNYPMDVAGVEKGDLIIEVNGSNVSTWDKAQLLFNLEHEGEFEIVIETEDGIKETKEILPMNHVLGFDIDLEDEIDSKKYEQPIVTYVLGNEETSVMKSGDLIVKVNGKDVKTWEDVDNEIGKEDKYTFEVLRDGETIEYELIPRDNIFGFEIDSSKNTGFINAIKYAGIKFITLIETMFIVIANLITGNLGISSLSGPVGIYGVVEQSAQAGVQNIIYLLAFLSINLGFLNALPFPAFDGGRVLFLIIEKIKGSPVNVKVENVFHTVGFILLMALMIYITFKDILNLF